MRLTRFFRKMSRRLFPEPMDADDRAMERALAFGWNQALQRLRETGWTEQTLEKVGKILFRVVALARAYRKKKERHNIGEWIGRAEALAEELRNVLS